MAPETTRLIRLYYAISFVYAAASTFTLPVFVLFTHDVLGASYLLGLALMALPNLVGSALDVPTGALADRYGRRLVYRWGLLLTLAGSVPYAITGSLPYLLLFVPVAGLGYAMTSGVLDSVVTSALHDVGDEVRIASSNRTSLQYAARIVAATTGALIYVVDPRLPFVASAVFTCLCIALSTLLPVTGDRTASNSPAAAGRGAGPVRQALELFRSSPAMRAVLVLLVAVQLWGNMMFVAYQPMLQRAGVPVGAMGAIYAGLSALSLLGSQLAKRLMDTRSTATLFQGMFLAVAVTAAGAALVTGWEVILLTVPLQLAFGMMQPLATTYVATRSPVQIKATALSVLGAVSSTWALAALVTGVLLDAAGVTAVGLVVAAGALVALVLVPRRILGEPAVAAHTPIGSPVPAPV